MQKLFKINSSISSYKLTIDCQCFSYLQNLKDNYVIIIDDNLFLKNQHFLQQFQNIVRITATEEIKDLSNISNVISSIKRFSLQKSDILIGIGGGIIQDITCFVASIYMRGVDWIYFPTTFLGICDSCIGGKSSINVNGIKNLVGNFYPPKEIMIDFSFLNSLDDTQIDSGICEALKICFAYHENKALTDFYDLYKEKNNHYLQNITFLSLEIKKWFIEKDEFDKNERKLLNFGHTFGHAIESESQYKITHGIAVGFGIIWAIAMSNIYFQNIKHNRIIILLEILKSILKKHTHFCFIINNLSVEGIYNKFVLDKKHQNKFFNCILINQDGFLIIKSFEKNEEFIRNFKSSYEQLKKIVLQ